MRVSGIWLRNKSTVAFVWLWESIHNPNFNCVEFEAIKNEAGLNSFVLTPQMLTPQQISYIYAGEADLLNAVLFGKTAKQWRDDNSDEKGNIRDQVTIYQLLVLANMESYNAISIKQGKTQAERMQLLHELAVQQMTTLSSLELSNLLGIEKK